MLRNWALNYATTRQRLAALLADGNTVADYVGGVGFTGTTNCSAWANQIGAFGPLVQASGANQPAISGNTLLFNGTSHFMTVSATLNQPFTRIMVVNPVSWTASDRLWDGTASPDVAMTFQTGSTPNIQMVGTDFGPASTNLTVGATHVLAEVWNGASSSMRIDANAAATGNVGTGNPAGLTLGAQSPGTTAFSNIQVSEVILRNGADSAGTLTSIIALLKSIWGTV